MTSKEIKSLTGIRGLAALFVIVFHWRAEMHQKTVIPGSFTKDILLKNFLSHGYLAVDLFFVLSGFVLCIGSSKIFAASVSAEDYRSFMYKRFSRIFPLYVIVTLLYFVMFRNRGIMDLLMNLTLLQGVNPYANNSIIPPGWSLTNEWIIYFIFPLSLYYLLKIKRIWILLLIPCLILLALSILRSPTLNWTNYSFLSAKHGFSPIISFTRGPASFMRAIAAYLLGIFAFLGYQKNRNMSFLKFLILPMFALLFCRETDILIILSMPFFILYITKTNFISKLLSLPIIHFIGLISYSLYVNHYLFIESYKSVSTYLSFDHQVFSFAYVIIGTFILSIVTYYGIEKPGIKFFKNNRLKIINVMSKLKLARID